MGRIGEVDLMIQRGVDFDIFSMPSELRPIQVIEFISNKFMVSIGGISFQEIRARPVHESHPNSLSGIYGMNAFPFHSDFAFRCKPPRNLVLYNPMGVEFKSRTLLAMPDLSLPMLKRRMEMEVFLVKNGRASFYSPLLAGCGLFRFDLNCIVPPGDSGSALLADLNAMFESQNPISVSWIPGLALWVDNWKCVHSREAVSVYENRILWKFWWD